MAIVNSLKKSTKIKQGNQTEVACAYKILTMDNGHLQLQIETNRNGDTNMEGDPTQIIKFSPKAMKQLAKVLLVDILLKEQQ